MRILLAVASAVFVVSSVLAADDDAAKIKALIPEAAGMSGDDLRKLGNDSVPTPDKLKAFRGETLLWWAFGDYKPDDGPKNPTSFKFIGETLNPAAIAGAFSGPKDKDGKFRKTATVIHPEYITDCTCKVDGDTATGVVSFKADKVYEGKVEYTARKKDGKWRIEEFRLPDHKTTLALGADGKWVKK